MGRSDAPLSVSEPFPISRVSDRYLIYDIDVITFLRREHHICGVLIGSIPQIPQQNVFLGVPLELMPEEARLLVQNRVAFISDDLQWHREGLQGLSDYERRRFLRQLEREGREAGKDAQRIAGEKKEIALKKIISKTNSKDLPSALVGGRSELAPPVDKETGSMDVQTQPSDSLTSSFSLLASADAPVFAITPTTSYSLLSAPSEVAPVTLPSVSNSFPLFAYLHSKGYFISPGLRFGCQYLVYPGDPLRFHSHFLAVGAAWNEELDLLAVVGGGRLGTGVKKGYLIGGMKEEDALDSQGEETSQQMREVRTFCIEWGGM